ncbi:glycosyltransferase family 2 protein [Diaphorobacter aerolatus]|uniref:Glycosyltransferase family 2 protein n=1 Tax=Diaphorobacter aerolatus TaxID=1288495 RepID=A0A7H0GFU3_9BURK|nr:glycosyltransferase family 2 protein [Diaphorobacter aerolatus]QNP47159.1 glycosyltransferase family 2 protein [Diaphorobacter aerolatus]
MTTRQHSDSSPASPWLSVLVPVYNVEPFLEECLLSVVAQIEDVAGVEVLVLNDCATDGSGELLQTLAQRWPGRLTLMQHERNQGLSAARNSMIEAARGEYLWFLDSDDKLLPGSISALESIAAAHAPDVVLCDFQVWRETSKWKHRLRGERHRSSFAGPARRVLSDRCEVLAAALMPGELHAWSKISKRALWGSDLRFPVGRYFEDMATMPLMMLRASTFYYADQPWVAYRQRSTSILATPNLGKALDQAHALVDFRAALQTSVACAGNEKVRLALAHQSARNFIGAMRYMNSVADGDPQKTQALQSIRQHFLASSPLSPEALCKAYAVRGWWLRKSKLQRWLKASEVA